MIFSNASQFSWYCSELVLSLVLHLVDLRYCCVNIPGLFEVFGPKFVISILSIEQNLRPNHQGRQCLIIIDYKPKHWRFAVSVIGDWSSFPTVTMTLTIVFLDFRIEGGEKLEEKEFKLV